MPLVVTLERLYHRESKDSSTKDCNFDIAQGTEMPFADSKEHYAEWKTNIIYYIRCKDGADNEPYPNRCSMIVRGYER